MKYLGLVKRDKANLVMPDTFRKASKRRVYEAVQVGNDILLVSAPLDRGRLERVEELADRSIKEHRRTLERLAK